MPFWGTESFHLETPAGLRRLVLLLYALVAPPFAALLALQAGPEARTPAVVAVLILCGLGALSMAWRRYPGAHVWVVPGGVVPTLCCAIAFHVSGSAGNAFLAVMGAPLAWSAVLFERSAVVAAWATAVLGAFAVISADSGSLLAGASNALLVAIIYGLVGWVVYGRTRRQREARLRSLAKHLNESELVVDPEGRIAEANDRAAAALGYEREELLGMELRRLWPPEWHEQASEDVRRAFASEGFSAEGEALRRDGSRFPVEVSTRPFDLGGRRLLHILVRDVTARRAAEANQRFLSALVEAMQEAVVTFGGDGRITSWSRGAELLFGWSAQEALGRSPFEFLVPPTLAAEVRTAFEVATALGATTHMGPRRRREGGVLVVHANIVRLQDHAGRPAGFLEVFRDVTDREAAARQLRESQERLVLALAGAQTEIWEWDLLGGWLRPGPRWAELLGAGDDGLAVRTPEELAAFADPADRAGLAERLRAHLAGETRSFLAEVRVRDGSGATRWAILRGRAGNPGAGGSPTRVLGMFRDTSDRKALEADLERALGEARTASRRREQLLAVVAHDLRNPLAAIALTAGGLHRVAGAANAEALLREREEVIGSASQRMERLIDDLLDVAAIQNGQLRLRRGSADPAELGREAVRVAAPVAERRGVRLSLDAPSSLPPALPCDGARVLQVLGNLVGNALQATEAGDAVVLRLQSAGGQVLFSVLDDGRGLPEGEAERLFEPYRRGENASHKGAGLGLAIARGIVDGHGGRIWAERRSPRGSAFHVSLPVSAGPGANEMAESPAGV